MRIRTFSQAGKALELMSDAIPLVGGLAGFVAAALQAGDRHVQTGRVVKVSCSFVRCTSAWPHGLRPSAPPPQRTNCENSERAAQLIAVPMLGRLPA